LDTCKVGGQVIHTVKYADNTVLLDEEEAVQGRLTETGRCSGMEMNVEKTKVMRISRQASSMHVITA